MKDDNDTSTNEEILDDTLLFEDEVNTLEDLVDEDELITPIPSESTIVTDQNGTHIVFNQESSTRIDKYLAETLPNLTRTYIQKLIQEEQILVNQKAVKANYKLSKGQTVTLFTVVPRLLEVIAQDIPVEIIYEDSELLIVNKPVGMVVHPAPGNYTDTLVNAIMFHCKDRLSSINGVARPGIVHRIDKDTSGLLIICKTDNAHNSIATQLKEHTVKRVYEGIVYNNLKEEEGTIDAPIGRGEKDRKRMSINYKTGKHAVTHYKTLERFDTPRYTYASFQLETGRTHQIRVHMAMLGNPLIGDPLYGPKNAAYSETGQLLHARTIGFIHPLTQEYMEFEVSPPAKFLSILDKLRKNSRG